jgi:ankyrin repeat protein
MASIWLVLVALMITGARAGQLDDFSNNLATDIGPLLALFGEDVTRQYLSESTLYIDYLIFALAPIGIMTAIVSAIRVCGGPALRAFIGRSREGEGDVEAELCTSTSRDVCELFSKGGITRALGRAQILEIVQIQKDLPSRQEDLAPRPEETAEMGIYLFRDRLRDLPAHELDEWEEVKRGPFFEAFTFKGSATSSRMLPIDGVTGLAFRSGRCEPADVEFQGQSKNTAPPAVTERSSEDAPSEENSRSEPFVQTPNLSINVGIVRRHIGYFYAAAFTGLLLQGGVIAMAGIVCWKLQWTQDGPPDTVVNAATIFSSNRNPLTFALGTVFLCSGMFWCAALIGQITEEQSFRRTIKRGPPPQSRLIWLQPGNQKVGDQTFDAFAYTEDPQRPLPEYITSRKNPREGFYKYTWGAVIFTLGGYIAQFIGLRGMNAYISIAQLGATLAMSLLRAGLRIQRLDNHHNQLGRIPDKVAGFELDWLAFELAKQDNDKPGKSSPANSTLHFWHLTGQSALFPATKDSSQSPIEPNSLVQKLLLYRCRLAHLTGHHPFHEISPWGFQEWPDEQVKVRAKARQLATVVCVTAEALFREHNLKELEMGFVAAMSSTEQTKLSQQFIKIIIEAPETSDSSSWRIDSALLEGTLGLWLWSLMSANELETENEYGSKVSIAEDFLRARIVSASATNDILDHQGIMQRELDLWLGTNMVKISETVLNLGEERICDASNLWQKVELGEREIWESKLWKALGEDGKPKPDRKPKEDWKRFFGWNAAPVSTPRSLASPASHESNRPPVSPVFSSASYDTPSGQSRQDQNIRVQFANCQPQNDLLTECSRELYSTILTSMMSVIRAKIGEVTPVNVLDQLRLDNAKVSGAVTAFTANGLGSHSDAFLCILPALRPHLSPPEGDSMIPSLLGAAARYRRSGDWDAAGKLVDWASAYYTSYRDGPLSLDQDTRENENLKNVVIAKGELCRWSFMHGSTKERRTLGYEGIEKMLRSFKYGNSGQQNQVVNDVLDRYYQISQMIKGIKPPPVEDLLGAIQGNRRAETLYLLCFAATMTLRSDTPAALPSAASNGWIEVVMALLDLSVLVDGSDNEGRVAISYFAEFGNVAMTKTLLEHGASPAKKDKHGRTPLWWAARRGRTKVVKLLLDTGESDPDSMDSDGRTPLSQASENGHEAIIQLLITSSLVSLDSKDSTDRTPLSWAAGNGMSGAVGLLVDMGNVGIDLRDETGRTPLSWAARNGHRETVSVLLKTGKADLHSEDYNGRSLLSLAAGAGHENVVRLLLEKDNAILDSKDSGGQTPLLWAARNGHEGVVRFLLKEVLAHADLADSVGRTPLWWAARNGYENIVRLLLSTGNANPDSSDTSSRTPLSWAARNGHVVVVELLLATGIISPDLNDDLGRTPLSWAAANGYESVVRALLGTGKVDKYNEDDEGISPLMYAERNGHTSIFKLLLNEQ